MDGVSLAACSSCIYQNQKEREVDPRIHPFPLGPPRRPEYGSWHFLNIARASRFDLREITTEITNHIRALEVVGKPFEGVRKRLHVGTWGTAASAFCMSDFGYSCTNRCFFGDPATLPPAHETGAGARNPPCPHLHTRG